MMGNKKNKGKGTIRLLVLLVIWVLVLSLLAGACALSKEPEDDHTASGGTAEPTASTQERSEPASETSADADSGPTGTTGRTNEEGRYIQPEGADWKLKLVNPWNKITEDYMDALDLSLYEGLYFDSRALPALKQMVQDANEAGCSLEVCSMYRSIETQTNSFNSMVEECIANGYVGQEAEDRAATEVARPYTSEHHLGLAVDFLGAGYSYLTEQFADTFDYKWLEEHCAEYGFIVRYRKEAQPITGIIFEPWHYRYVGTEAAGEIMSRGISLEEYLAEKGL